MSAVISAAVRDNRRAIAVSREHGLGWAEGGSHALFVDTANAAPPEMARFQPLNPFFFDVNHRIPVPGQNLTACSVESVWQGLKLVDGDVDFSMFQRGPEKRPPEASRTCPGYAYEASQFLCGDRVLDLVTARYILYLPSYLYMLEHHVPQTLIDTLENALDAGRTLVFFDWDSNFDIDDPRTSFSHSAILASWFNGDLDDRFLSSPGSVRASQNVGADLPVGSLMRYHTYHQRQRLRS